MYDKLDRVHTQIEEKPKKCSIVTLNYTKNKVIKYMHCSMLLERFSVFLLVDIETQTCS